jgi:hypothetical protein
MDRRQAPSSGGVSGLFGQAIVNPGQFRDIWNGSNSSPERSLAAAVLETAVDDLLKYRQARGRRCDRIYREAYQWLSSPDREWPFSFINICDCLRLSPEALRKGLLGPKGSQAETAVA